MAHGYMREFDENRGDDRDRWRNEDRERGWRPSGGNRSERNLSFMLGDRDWEGARDRDRGRFERDAWERAPRNFSSHQDDHYRSWRDKQMEALDRDYSDYCREREQQFHSDFDAWRSRRQGNQEPLRTGMTQTAQSGDPTGELELSEEMADPPQAQPDAMGAATLGTTSGRRR
jgi:hypothetical protein